MDVKGKLIELLKQIKYVSVENAVNILIDNGVTVQEWVRLMIGFRRKTDNILFGRRNILRQTTLTKLTTKTGLKFLVTAKDMVF